MLLDVMRRGSNSIFGKILFSVLLLASVLGLALGYNVSSHTLGGDAVATVAKQDISTVEFDRLVRQRLAGSHLTAATAYREGMLDKLLQGEVQERLVKQDAYDLGLRPDDATVRADLAQKMAPYITPDRPASLLLQEVMRQRGVDEAGLAQQLRDQIAAEILQGAIQSGTSLASETETSDLFRFAAEERTIRYVFLPDSAITDYKTPTDAVLLPFYQVGKERFAVPETRRFSLVIVDKGGDVTPVSDADLQKAYQDDIAKYQEPERRRMTQALLKTQGEAQAVADKVKAGAGVEAAVTSVTGKGSAYLGTQDFAKDGLAPEIAGPTFAATKNAVIGPIKTALGWHVLQLIDILPPVTKPFAEVKETLRAEAAKSMASDALYARATQLDDALSGGTTLDDAAKMQGLAVQKFGSVRADGTFTGGDSLPASIEADKTAILKAAFQTNEGETAPSMQLKNGTYAILRVDAVTAKSWKPFGDVKDELAKLWIADQQNVINGDKAHAAVTALDDKSKTFEQIAADNHTAVKTLTFTRTKPVPPLTSTAAQKFMELRKGQHAGASATGGFIVGELVSSRMPPAPAAADLAAIEAREPEQTTQRYTAAYMNFLQAKYGVKINHDVLDKMYGGAKPDTDSGSAP